MIKRKLIPIYKNIVLELAKTSTCDRAQVGSILIKHNRIVCSAYNGSTDKADHCDAVGHIMVDNHCIRSIHSEMNLVTFCARNGISTNKCKIMTSHYPCPICIKILAQSGIDYIYYCQPYRNDENPFVGLIKAEEI